MNKYLRQTQKYVKRNGATILTVMGGIGVVTTTVMAVKATPKAIQLLEQAKEEKGEDLTKTDVIRVAGPAYIPTLLMGVGTLACVFGANMLNKKQQAHLVSAYALVSNSYSEYKEKVKELYGEDGVHEIQEAVANDKYEDQDVPDENDGTNLFYDTYSERFFRASNETVLSAEYVINKILAEDCGVYLNELYDLFEIPGVDYGETMGWSSAQMMEMYWSSWIDFYHTKATTKDGEEYFIIDYTEPTADFADY